MKSLLLVEDDESLGATLQLRLQKSGFEVAWAQSIAEAKKLISKNFDLILLDLSLPDGSGFEFAKDFRKRQGPPFLFMTALNTAENRLQGFELGAEEFIPKPFHVQELLLRISHIFEKHKSLQQVMVGPLLVSFDSYQLRGPNSEVVEVPPKEMNLLKLLIENSPRVYSRDEILDQIWGEDQFPTQRTVDNAILKLRKLLSPWADDCIRSVRGIGYQWLEQNTERGKQ